MKRLPFKPVLVLTAAALVLGVAAPGHATPTRNDATSAPSSLAAADPQAAQALAKQQNISVAEASKRLGRQASLSQRGEALEKALAGRSGGSYLDNNGNLVVTTIDNAGDVVVARGGARPQRVDDSEARLDRIVQQLNAHSKQRGSGSVQGWYVDVPTNTVVVTATAGAKDAKAAALVKAAKRFGKSVRVESRSAAQAPISNEWLVGGYSFNGNCSMGFNAKTTANYNVVVTAGHCLKAGWNSKGGYNIGQTRTKNFPTDDFGTFWNSYPSYWQPSTSVSKYNGTFVEIRGQWNAPAVGTVMCKSGYKTGYTCGKITARNVTVSYPQGAVYGLTQHTACSEPGDSGGANIGFYNGHAYAIGVSSGSSSVSKTDKRCRSKVGLQNISYYQPIGEALSRNGLKLVYKP